VALISTQDIFTGTAQDVHSKELVIQEAASKSAVLQSYTFFELAKTCKEYSRAEDYSGNCTEPDPSTPHPFLYRWYNSDALTSLCLELASCKRVAGGKILDVLVTASYKTNNKIMTSVVRFRKAK